MLLGRGHEIHVVGRFAKAVEKDVQFHRVNLAREIIPSKVSDGVDAVFHVAAKTGVWGPASAYRDANVFATNRVVDACRESGIKHLVYTSTPSVVFTGKPFRGKGEELPYGSNWICHYARTKAIAEKTVLDANGQGVLKTIALRPHLVWGSGDPHLIPKIISRAQSGKLRIVGDGSNLVDLTHVDNAAHAHLLALDALVSGNHLGGKAYFVSQGEPTSLWPWLNNLLDRLGEPQVTRKVSLRSAYWTGLLFECVWRIMRFSGDPPMTRFVALQLGKDHWFDISAANRELGYQPIVSMEEGLSETISWLKSA